MQRIGNEKLFRLGILLSTAILSACASQARPPLPPTLDLTKPICGCGPPKWWKHTGTYTVYFDWNSDRLEANSLKVISDIAGYDRQYNQIIVTGYTDTSGTARGNQTLSLERARKVAAQLIADGVPQSQISIYGYGEKYPWPPIGPGVENAQTRRVEISAGYSDPLTAAFEAAVRARTPVAAP